MLWHAEGQVLCSQARSTSVAFDVYEAQAGKSRTYLVAVQVVESGAQGRVVQSGLFLQVVVAADDLLAAPKRDHREPGVRHRDTRRRIKRNMERPLRFARTRCAPYPASGDDAQEDCREQQRRFL